MLEEFKKFVTRGNPVELIVSFLIVAWVLFLLMKAYQRLDPPAEPAKTESYDYCRTDIPIAAVRCPNCTSRLVTATS